MSWPNVSDYQDAAQNPQLNFDDAELKAGKPETDSHGFPRPRSGQFACVFRIQGQKRDWAVKCFTQEVKDLQERYLAIDNHLSAIKLPHIVGFDYLTKGIRVGGQWYPILKMEWVQGELLSQYIEQHLKNSDELRQLALRWLEMAHALQVNSIAHGDLQERNVLVVNGQLKLVDYDGMFVPTLSGRKSNERGQRNYQHPQRTESDFGPHLDNFSEWVIYVSIIALSVDPSLWAKCKAGDECLLFRESDFRQPLTSPVMALLEHSSNSNIRTLESLFQSMLSFSPQQVPSLAGQVPTLFPNQPSSVSPQVSWWSDHVEAAQQKSGNTAGLLNPSLKSASWILDFANPVDEVNAPVFSQSVNQPRFVILLSANVILFAFAGGALMPILFPSTIGLDSLYLIKLLLGLFVLTDFMFLTSLVSTRYYYRKDPAVIEKSKFAVHEKEANEILKNLEEQLSNIAKEKNTLQAKENERRKKIEADIARLREREKRETVESQAVLVKTMASIDTRRRIIDQEEQSKMGKLQNDIGAKINVLQQQISALASSEVNEITSQLTVLQNQYVESYLKRHRVGDSPFAGLTYTSRSNLERALVARGIYTAYDVSYARVDAVYGFGPKRTQALVNWRNQLEQQAQFTMPRDLSPDAKNAIRLKYLSQKNSLESQRISEQSRFSTEEMAIRNDARQQRQAIDLEQAMAQTQATQKNQEIKKRFAQEVIPYEQAQSQLTKEFGEKYLETEESEKQIRQKIISASWQVAKLNHEWERHKNLSYTQYLKTVLLGRRAYN